MIPLKKIVKSEDETSRLAKEFVQLIEPNDKIVLEGQLGTGKTFFIKNALQVLGIKNVNSPTFAIVNEYTGKYRIYHFDFFRVKSAAELIDIGWLDYMNDERAISFIEWGNLLPEVLPASRYEISIEMNEDFSREISIKRYE
jgi:tRNA threonylcarbamoyladenosine biosynthesis protein TsaE